MFQNREWLNPKLGGVTDVISSRIFRVQNKTTNFQLLFIIYIAEKSQKLLVRSLIKSSTCITHTNTHTTQIYIFVFVQINLFP